MQGSFDASDTSQWVVPLKVYNTTDSLPTRHHQHQHHPPHHVIPRRPHRRTPVFTSSKQVTHSRALKSCRQRTEEQNESPPLDRFGSFPIKSTSQVARMAQYFVQVWAPEHGYAFAFRGHSNPYLSLLWPFAMQHDMYFEALIALSLATWLSAQGLQSQDDRSFIYHHGNVISKLHQRIQHPDTCATDATLLTVTTLGTIDYILGEHTKAANHVQGVRLMVSRRGGLRDSSQWEHLVKTNVAAYESLWAFVSEGLTTTNQFPQPSSTFMMRPGELPTYMSHPFRPEVCIMLAKLPRGFCDLALKGAFSLQMIRVLSTINECDSEPETPVSQAGERLATTLQQLLRDIHRLATLQTTTTEHLLCYGLISYTCIVRHIYPDPSFYAVYENIFDVLTRKVLWFSPDQEDLERKCYLWTSTLIATTLLNISNQPSNRYIVFEHLLRHHDEVKCWHKLEQTLKLFFWTNELAALCRRSWQEAIDRQKEQLKQPSRPPGMSIRDVIL